MRLTPIHVRGKRKAPATGPPLVLQSSGANKMPKSLAAVRASRSLRQRPGLVSLPAEILESILLYSMSTSLPRVSPLVGAKLSGTATLLRFLIWAFHDTWDQAFGVALTRTEALEPLGAGHGDPGLQSAVLALPWVTIDFILQAQQTWADRYGRGRPYQHHHVDLDDEDDNSSMPPPSGQLASQHNGVCDPFDARACFEADYQRAVARFLEPDHTWRRDVHRAARIPSDLITGPWDDELLRRLFWVVRCGHLLSQESVNDLSWETKMLSLRNAVLDASEPQVFVFNYVLRDLLLNGQVPPRDILRKEVHNLDVRLRWGGDSPDGRHVVRLTRETLQHLLDS